MPKEGALLSRAGALYKPTPYDNSVNTHELRSL